MKREFKHEPDLQSRPPWETLRTLVEQLLLTKKKIYLVEIRETKIIEDTVLRCV